MILILVIISLVISIIILLWNYHIQKYEKNYRAMRLRDWENQSKEISQIKLGFYALKSEKTTFDHDLNAWVNGEKANHREITKLNELHNNVSARLNNPD